MRKVYTQDTTGGSVSHFDGIYKSDCFSIRSVEQLFFKTYML